MPEQYLINNSELIETNDLSKRCTKCGETKPLDQFNYDSRRKDGRRSECKVCKQIQVDAWRKQHKDHLNALARDRSKSPHYRRKGRERTRRWKERHPDIRKVDDARYNRLFNLAENDLSAEQWEEIKEFYQQSCAYCGRSKRLVKSHVIPLAKNGDHTAANIVPACVTCASGRYGKHEGLSQPEIMHPVRSRVLPGEVETERYVQPHGVASQ